MVTKKNPDSLFKHDIETQPIQTNPAEAKSFESAFSELEGIVALMESGQMSLEASLAAYQSGNELLKFCQKSLADVEQQVQILNERNQLTAFKAENN